MWKKSREKENVVVRDVGMDLLRILACIMVVLLHVSDKFMLPFDSSDFDAETWQIASIFDSITRWSVPVFVMISGTFMLNKDIPIKKLFQKYIFRLVLLLFFWNLAYNFSLLTEEMSIRRLLSCILFYHKGYHLWFIYMLIATYAFIPVLKVIVDSKQEKYFLALWLACNVIFCGIGEIGGGIPGQVELFASNIFKEVSIGYLGFFILGYYVYHRKPFSAKMRRVIFLLGLVGMLGVIFGTLWLFSIHRANCEVFYANMNLFVVLMSLAVFAFFTPPHLGRAWNTICYKWKGAIKIVSDCTLGVYLVHIFVLQFILEHFLASGINIVVLIPIVWLLTFIISLMMVIALRRIPYINFMVR